ncbi:F-box/WD repeat-containing protein 2 [Anabrus simplex]|uniref:F-box/WD repeat-containing protein 2 n=1 Tax=Anabrus simplex TaxID=316456 RepID=UPI0034DCE75C
MTSKEDKDRPSDFEAWLSSVSDTFRGLTVQKQSETLLTLINLGSPEQRYHLLKNVSVALQRDILVLLPVEIQELICYYIDTQSLLRACCVSKRWNGIISSLSSVWRRKCIELGSGPVEEECVNWKSLCLSTLKLVEGIHNGTAFRQHDIKATCLSLEHITGLDYCKGFLIGCADNLVGVWRAEDYELISLFSVLHRISCVQICDGKLLAFGHSTGHITTWHLNTDRYDATPFQEYRSHAGVIMSLSVCSEIDLMVSGASDSLAKIWCVSSGTLLRTLFDHSHWIVQVTLLPFLDSKPNKTLFERRHTLLTMTRDHVRIFSWKADSECKSVYGDINTIDESHLVFPLKSVLHFFTPGCHVNAGKVIYINQTMVTEEEAGNAEIIFKSLATQNVVGRVKLFTKVRKLLAVGDKFALLLLPQGHAFFNLRIVELSTGKMIGGCYLPHSSSSTPDLAQVVVGETAWLNGLSQQQPDDLVVALGLPKGRIRVVTWRDLQETSTG